MRLLMQMAALPGVIYTSSKADEAFLEALREDIAPAATGSDAPGKVTSHNSVTAFAVETFCPELEAVQEYIPPPPAPTSWARYIVFDDAAHHIIISVCRWTPLASGT